MKLFLSQCSQTEYPSNRGGIAVFVEAEPRELKPWAESGSARARSGDVRSMFVRDALISSCVKRTSKYARMFKNVFGSGFLVRTAHVFLTWVITLVLFLHDTGKSSSVFLITYTQRPRYQDHLYCTVLYCCSVLQLSKQTATKEKP